MRKPRDSEVSDSLRKRSAEETEGGKGKQARNLLDEGGMECEDGR
jgi:hypothetical protein